MGTVVTKWATQCFAWGSTLHTVEAIEQLVNIFNKHSRRQVLTIPTKKYKHMSSSTLVSLSQLANMKNIFKTRYQVTLE
jgi:hypothetical protein